jgi:hypothetical protein
MDNMQFKRATKANLFTWRGEELSTLSIPSPPAPPPRIAVKIFRPTARILAQGEGLIP